MTTPMKPPQPPIKKIAPEPSSVKIIPGGEKVEGDFLPPAVIAPPPNAVITTNENRDGKGRFLTGNKGGGRKKGSRNKLSEVFLNTIVEDFIEHGAEALSRLREADPATYLRIMVAILPKHLIAQFEMQPETPYEELSDDEIIELMKRAKKRRDVEKILEASSR